jgi:hypothetical protein
MVGDARLIAHTVILRRNKTERLPNGSFDTA